MLTEKAKHQNQYPIAIILMLLSSAFVALGTLLGKWLTLAMALPALVFLRFFLPALILWWVALITNTFAFNIKLLGIHCLRAFFVVLSQYALLYYLIYGSVLNGTLLFMTSPLFVPLISRVIQKNSIKLYQWISIIIGFSGVIFILKPTLGILDGYGLIGLASGFFNALSQVCYHKISKNMDSNNASLHTYSISALITLVPVIIFLHPISPSTLIKTDPGLLMKSDPPSFW